ncbi:MAG: ABC transporter ATP-binding protein [Chloroflexota bacterium]
MTTEPLVSLRDVQVQRGSHTLLNIPLLDVHRGELLGIIGPNGAGKTTLATVLGLLERPSRGEVSFDGRPVSQHGVLLPLRRRTAMVLQEPLLFDTTVFENVATGLRFRGVSKLQIQTRVHGWLGKLGIAHLAERAARTLSGGEAQRTSLARALVLDPELLILDEPFRGLDPPSREEILADTLPHLRSGMTTVLISHDHEEAFTLCDRLGVLISGRVMQLDGPLEVLEKPATAEVERFIRAQRRRAGFADSHAHFGAVASV